ncbi:MAG: DUF4149 domain-containing protein [Candidatus Latescibacteria bacterium]|nr:DUF4149 domain-containing protein [Candidatus Latescibacterota bacterium]
MKTLYLFSVWLHILSAVVWIGGAVFIAAVVVPTMRHEVDRVLSGRLTRKMGERFRTISWVCLGLLLLTGLFNLSHHGVLNRSLFLSAFWIGEFGRVLALKLIFVFIILMLSLLHDFILGPRVMALLESDHPDLTVVARQRKSVAWLARFNLLLALGAVMCGVLLVRWAL